MLFGFCAYLQNDNDYETERLTYKCQIYSITLVLLLCLKLIIIFIQFYNKYHWKRTMHQLFLDKLKIKIHLLFMDRRNILFILWNWKNEKIFRFEMRWSYIS